MNDFQAVFIEKCKNEYKKILASNPKNIAKIEQIIKFYEEIRPQHICAIHDSYVSRSVIELILGKYIPACLYALALYQCDFFRMSNNPDIRKKYGFDIKYCKDRFFRQMIRVKHPRIEYLRKKCTE